jgi:putative ABC transport system substrate-binding protein
MRRREFIGLLGGAAAALPRTTRAAESDKVYRIALVHPAAPVSDLTETGTIPGWPTLLKELRRLGYVEGRNLVLLRYSAGGDQARFGPMVREVVSAAPDVVVFTSARLALLFKATTSTVPVVGMMADPIAFGIVTSLARPDGIITGVTADSGQEIWGKRLAILLEVAPMAKRVGFLISESVWDGTTGVIFREAAQRLSVSIVGSRLKATVSEAEYRRVFTTLEQEQAQALIINEQSENTVWRHLIVELAEKVRLPAVYPNREFAKIGGLISYGNDIDDLYRRLATYIDLILKGAKPRDLPIYQATKIPTVINLKTAKLLGLELPRTLLAQADEVIE